MRVNVYKSFSQLRRRMLSDWRMVKLRFLGVISHQQLEIGRTTTFRVPLRTDGCGSLRIGSGNCFGYSLAPRIGSGEILIQSRFPGSTITIGENNTFSNNVSLIATDLIRIGDDCLIGDQVMLVDSDFHAVEPTNRRRSIGSRAPVIIGDNVWLGSRVVVLKGVSIGNNTVVGAMSLVTKSLPSNCMAVGIPAKIIKRIE